MNSARISEVCEVIAGQSPPSTSYNQDNIGLPFFQGNADFGNIYPTVRYWCDSPKKIAKVNDILISVRAPVGAVNINNTEACIGRGLAALRTGDKIDRRYLFHFLVSNRKQIEDLGTGSTFKAITMKTLRELEIPLPPLKTQQKIAAILDEADKLRRLNKKLIKKYEQLSQSLFLEMFGDPVNNPKGWEIKTIEDFVQEKKGAIKRGPFGGALKKEIFVERGFLVYEQFHALNDDFTMERYFISEKKYQELKAFRVEPGDIIISCSGVNLGKLAIVPKEAKAGIMNQALLKVSLNEDLMLNTFFLYVFRNKNFKTKFFGGQRGSGVPNFPPMSTFKQFGFIVPPINLQKEFAVRLTLIENQKLQAQRTLEYSDEMFNSLLQCAFKGELVKD